MKTYKSGIALVRLHDHQAWVAGDNVALAEIFLSHTLLWAKICGAIMTPNAGNYLNRAMNRPAFLKAQERNNL